MVELVSAALFTHRQTLLIQHVQQTDGTHLLLLILHTAHKSRHTGSVLRGRRRKTNTMIVAIKMLKYSDSPKPWMIGKQVNKIHSQGQPNITQFNRIRVSRALPTCCRCWMGRRWRCMTCASWTCGTQISGWCCVRELWCVSCADCGTSETSSPPEWKQSMSDLWAWGQGQSSGWITVTSPRSSWGSCATAGGLTAPAGRPWASRRARGCRTSLAHSYRSDHTQHKENHIMRNN